MLTERECKVVVRLVDSGHTLAAQRFIFRALTRAFGRG